jgi:hypothetical protein
LEFHIHYSTLNNIAGIGAELASYRVRVVAKPERRNHLDTITRPTTPRTPWSNEAAPAKKAYKSVPENYRVLSDAKYHKVVADLEAILLDISTDGVGINTPDGRISPETLKHWAESLRNALETLSKAQ